MGNRADEIRKRIAKRKRMSNYNPTASRSMLLPSDEERYGSERFSSYEGGPSSEGGHPLFSKELFILKILGSSVIVLCTAILFQNQVPGFDKARSYVKQTMTEEFQFAAISTWYEDQFGKPLALLPEAKENQTGTEQRVEYALPASSKVIENFKSNGQGIMVETTKGSTVEAMKGGLVIFAGKKDSLGQTVIIQHDDKSESWYGNLNTIEVNQYETIKTGSAVGTVTDGEDSATGEFYFAIKKGDAFIDPIQVISFE